MKLVHTADWQIGMKAGSAGSKGELVREARFESAQRVVEAARDSGADFILVAGDTFEDNGVLRANVQKTADILAAFGGPVYIIPGNHDYLAPASVWEHPAWRSHDNLHVLTTAEPVRVPGGTLFPCPVVRKYSSSDPTAWIEASGAEGIRIGLAHGTVEGAPAMEDVYPIARDAAERSGLDYLALGHFHSFSSYEGKPGEVRMAYSGTHETSRFGERDSGQVLLVEIGSSGDVPAITPLRTGVLDWQDIEREIAQEGDLARLKAEVEATAEPGKKLVRLKLKGLASLSEFEEVDRIEQLLFSRFLFGTVDSTELRPVPTEEELLEAIPAGVMREVAEDLKRRSELAVPPGDDYLEKPEVAALALVDLYSIAREVSR